MERLSTKKNPILILVYCEFITVYLATKRTFFLNSPKNRKNRNKVRTELMAYIYVEQVDNIAY